MGVIKIRWYEIIISYKSAKKGKKMNRGRTAGVEKLTICMFYIVNGTNCT